jgi:thiol-disulfide isomerase/thioredoxin
MIRLAFTWCAFLLFAAPVLADDKQPAEPAPPAADAAKPLVEQLKEKPDDRALFDKYMISNLQQIRSLIGSDPDKAEAQLAEMKQLIESLEPQTDAGKKLVGRGLSAVKYFENQVEMGRVSLDELAGKLKENPDDMKSIPMYFGKLMMEASPLTRTEPDKAEKLVNDAKELLTATKEKAQEEATKTAIDRMLGSLVRVEQQIETGKKLAALVGSDAAPLAVEAWVNGDPLTDGDLKGKVVLLDFWAVWCGPCIGTFPNLIDWHEKYADKGLVIIGLTRYYNYTWDEAAARPKRASGEEKATPEQEQEMLAKFAENKNLHHRLGIQKDRSMSDHYAVSGIPHFVVIDREGKIRLFRIGGGSQNTQAIEEMIQKLIADG